jgi:hypothetical protein
VDIVNPKWHLTHLCACCNQGYPTFKKCSNCGYVTVVCEEMGDTFLNPKHLEQGFTSICPQCKKSPTTDFVVAKSEDILNAGFTKEQYH